MTSRHFDESTVNSCALPDDCSAELRIPLAFRIVDVCRTTGLGRTTIYAAIKSGRLSGRKLGRTTVVLASDLKQFLHGLPTIGQSSFSKLEDE
jgi:excisionase family DNA binding protein